MELVVYRRSQNVTIECTYNNTKQSIILPLNSTQLASTSMCSRQYDNNEVRRLLVYM